MHGFKGVLVSNHVNNMLYVFIDRNARVRMRILRIKCHTNCATSFAFEIKMTETMS